MQEHCPLLAVNPVIKRIKTVTLEDGKGPTLSREIYNVLEEYDSLLKIRIIGTDSCNKMTGGELGTHAFLEYLLKRPLFRICCILHIMESLWKRFFRLVDGESSSSTQLTGEVGKTLTTQTSGLQQLRTTRLSRWTSSSTSPRRWSMGFPTTKRSATTCSKPPSRAPSTLRNTPGCARQHLEK